MYQYAAITRQGAKHNKNDDRVMIQGNYIVDGELKGEASDSLLAVICDGVGGEACGDEAAEIACMSFLPFCGKNLSIFDVAGAVLDANKAVVNYQNKDSAHRNMSTTIAGVYIDETQHVVFNAGDTRVYSVDDGNHISLLSKDHTEAQRMMDCGVYDSTDKAPKKMQHTINRYIGGKDKIGEAKLLQGKVNAIKAYLLCSDGLYKKLTDTDMLNCLIKPCAPIEKCRALVNLAIEKGSADDISIVLVEKIDLIQ